MNYIAIIGDIVNSKQTSNRSSIQERLKQQLNRINHSFTQDFASPFTITKGDEFQALCKPNPYIFLMIDQIQLAFRDEVEIRFGIGWNAPVVGEPVYRLYNPNNGDHHYTTSKGEHDILVTLGWRSENIGWQSGGTIPVYRLYNPNALGAGSHHYTTSKGEADYLDSIGWNYEGIGWYAE